MNDPISLYLDEMSQILRSLSVPTLERMVQHLLALRIRRGRLFLLGVGGSAATCSHAVNDFRKLTNIEAYTPTDNVAEVTARTNDEGWRSVFEGYLRVSRVCSNDLIFVLSVGGGDAVRNVSLNLVDALGYAKGLNVPIIAIVGRDGGYTAKVANACLVVPNITPDKVTPYTESIHAVLCHLLVSHPILQTGPTKW